jgi:hypothetical protein
MLVGRAFRHAMPPLWKPLQLSAGLLTSALPAARPPLLRPCVLSALVTPFTTLDVIGDGLVEQELWCDNLIRKRRRKMNKHKHSKMLKKQRFLRRKLGK